MGRGKSYAVIYLNEDGQEEVYYRRPISDMKLALEVLKLRRIARHYGRRCLYSLRRISNP